MKKARFMTSIIYLVSMLSTLLVFNLCEFVLLEEFAVIKQKELLGNILRLVLLLDCSLFEIKCHCRAIFFCLAHGNFQLIIKNIFLGYSILDCSL
jgi:hypothetical protein